MYIVAYWIVQVYILIVYRFRPKNINQSVTLFWCFVYNFSLVCLFVCWFVHIYLFSQTEKRRATMEQCSLNNECESHRIKLMQGHTNHVWISSLFVFFNEKFTVSLKTKYGLKMAITEFSLRVSTNFSQHNEEMFDYTFFCLF